MILVLTTQEGDHSHEKFIDWLDYYNADYTILTGEDIYYNKKQLLVDNGELFINGINFSKNVNVVFNRRWLTIDRLQHKQEFEYEYKFRKIIVDELYELRNFFKTTLKNALFFPDIEKMKVNKLNVLYQAKKVGLKYPDYIISNDKNCLKDFVIKHKQIITKAIGDFGYVDTKNSLVNPIYTKVIDENFIELLPEQFCFSLFQQLILKKFEYRIMYFNKHFYTAKLLTQENEFSFYDSRAISSDDDEIRIVKSTLPRNIEDKLTELMECLGLNIGFIDLIEDIEGDFYFLEVNPVGQISGYSTRINSTFERDVVLEMIKKDEEKNKSNGN